jgi:hypothetical protein
MLADMLETGAIPIGCWYLGEEREHNALFVHSENYLVHSYTQSCKYNIATITIAPTQYVKRIIATPF